MLEIRFPTKDELSAVRTLRLEVLKDDQPPAESVEPTAEDLDPSSLHAAAFDGDKVASVLRVNPTDEPGVFVLSRVATRIDYRGRGIAGRVIEFAEKEAVRRGAREMILEARPPAEPVYARLGYERYEPKVLDEPGYIPMRKVL